MRLYREYKNEEIRKEKEKKDREETGADDKAIIIYEHSAAGNKVLNAVLFLLMLVLIGAVITMAAIAR